MKSFNHVRKSAIAATAEKKFRLCADFEQGHRTLLNGVLKDPKKKVKLNK